jgi:molybdenum cofactor guanylyltransferase
VRAPGQELPELPGGVRVVEDAREGNGPLQGLLAGLEAVDGELAFVASTDMPFLHPRFVAAVCATARDADAAVPLLAGFRQPLAAAYRTALAPLVAELIEQGQMKPAFLFERCETRWLDDLPYPESVRNLNAREDYEAALAEPEPTVRVRCFGPLRRPPAEVRAATLGTAAVAIGVELGPHVLAALNGDQIARDPLEPLAEGDEVAFMAADAGG